MCWGGREGGRRAVLVGNQDLLANDRVGVLCRDYGGLVLIAVLLFTEITIAKLAAHGITPEEVRQVNDSDRGEDLATACAGIRADDRPDPRRPHPYRRLNPEPNDVGAWFVRTAWDSSVAQVSRYQRDR